MIKPIGRKIAVLPEAQKEVTKSGLYIPDSVKENIIRGKVIAVAENMAANLTVKVDDTVVFFKSSGYPVFLDEGSFIIIEEDNILCII